MTKAAEANIIEFDTDAIRAREAQVAQEADDAIIERLRKRFGTLDRMAGAVRSGTMRALIITGPPGVGKSYGVEAALASNKPEDRKIRYEILRSRNSPLGIYTKLWEFRDSNCVIVFDDCDNIYFEQQSLDLLKAALDSSRQRWISWNTDNRVLRTEGIPNRFEFNAGAIFITNVKFSLVKSKKLREHLDALEDRCHYMDLEIDTMREKLLRIRQTVADGMLDPYGLTATEQQEIVQYVEDNADQLRRVSQRTVIKLGELCKSFPSTWRNEANETILTRVRSV